MKLLSMQVLRILKRVFFILENKYILDLIYLIHMSFLKMKLGVCRIGSGQSPRLPAPNQPFTPSVEQQ